MAKISKKKIPTFTINGKTYIARELDFNAIADLEDAGLSLSKLAQRPMTAARAYLSLYMGNDLQAAGIEIEKHVTNGGDLTGIMEAFSYGIEESHFFQALSKATTQDETAVAADPGEKDG